ncbi:IF factor, partial [Turnix velox]|nr:IF factor [Turnix velox]
ERGGMIGNIYSMGLALQALISTEPFYSPRPWDCDQALSVVYKHEYTQPMAIAQLLPALVGRSYLDVASLSCSTLSPEVAPLGIHSPLKEISVGQGVAMGAPLPPPQRALIQVHYSIHNTLVGNPFSESITLWVPAGSTLLQVLQEAQEENSEDF